jgi:predicted membrane protein
MAWPMVVPEIEETTRIKRLKGNIKLTLPFEYHVSDEQRITTYQIRRGMNAQMGIILL